MTRSISASVVTELANDDMNMVSLLYMGFASPIYLTDAGRDVDSGGNTYISSPHMLDIGNVQENADIRVGALTFTLSSVEQTYAALFLTNDYIDVRVQYWKALLDDSWSLIGTALQMFDGRISGAKFADTDPASGGGGKSKLMVECASHWANFETIAGRRSNDSSQKIYFPTDEGMEFASHSERDIVWGRKP